MTPKAGRKPIGERAMTPAEKQRRYREGKKQNPDHKQAYFALTGDVVDELDSIVEFFGLPSRSAALRAFATQGVKDCMAALKKSGANQQLPTSQADQAVVLEARKLVWETLYPHTKQEANPND